jgi:putative transposase
MDFVMEALSKGRRLKCLTIVDGFTKESIDIVVDRGILGLYVARVLDHWAYAKGVTLKLIQAGKVDAECLHRVIQWQASG